MQLSQHLLPPRRQQPQQPQPQPQPQQPQQQQQQHQQQQQQHQQQQQQQQHQQQQQQQHQQQQQQQQCMQLHTHPQKGRISALFKTIWPFRTQILIAWFGDADQGVNSFIGCNVGRPFCWLARPIIQRGHWTPKDGIPHSVIGLGNHSP